MGMQIKKFQAPTLQKALEQIRAELGDGAIILQADPVKTGLLGRHGVEVTAAIDRKALAPRFEFKLEENDRERQKTAGGVGARATKALKGLFQREDPVEAKSKTKTEQVKEFAKQAVEESAAPGMGQLYAMKTFVDPIKKEVEQIKAQLSSEKGKTPDRVPSTALLETEIKDLKATIQSFIHEQKLKDGGWGDSLVRLENFWKEKGMGVRQIAHFFSILERENQNLENEKVIEALHKKITGARIFESRRKRIVVLIGPTGVGKTTTIAKLAAFEKLKMNRRVSLVTLDDYKIGGTDQLGHYARILEVPFLKCRSDISLEEQIKTIDADTIFVDTFGVSPKDDQRIAKLRKAIHFRDPSLQDLQELHLVLPVGLSSGDVEVYMDSFSRINPNYLLFTKWDETNNWGGMLAAILTSERPVSFISHGQEVPDDISVFDSHNFIETITGVEN